MTEERISLWGIGQLWNYEQAFQDRGPQEWPALDHSVGMSEKVGRPSHNKVGTEIHDDTGLKG